MEKESQVKIKLYITMMDSMTSEELDSSNPKLINVSRMMQIACGCGRIQEVMEMGVQVASQAMEQDGRGLKFLRGKLSSLSCNKDAEHRSKALPPKISGMGGLQNLMKQMGPAEDMMGMFGGGDE